MHGWMYNRKIYFSKFKYNGIVTLRKSFEAMGLFIQLRKTDLSVPCFIIYAKHIPRKLRAWEALKIDLVLNSTQWLPGLRKLNFRKDVEFSLKWNPLQQSYKIRIILYINIKIIIYIKCWILKRRIERGLSCTTFEWEYISKVKRIISLETRFKNNWKSPRRALIDIHNYQLV